MPQGSSLGLFLFLLNVNDRPLATNFKTTFFANDTYLQLSDNNLQARESRVNCELNIINSWLAKKLISLNLSKMIIFLKDKHPYKTTNNKFVVKLRQRVHN